MELSFGEEGLNGRLALHWPYFAAVRSHLLHLHSSSPPRLTRCSTYGVCTVLFNEVIDFLLDLLGDVRRSFQDPAALSGAAALGADAATPVRGGRCSAVPPPWLCWRL